MFVAIGMLSFVVGRWSVQTDAPRLELAGAPLTIGPFFPTSTSTIDVSSDSKTSPPADAAIKITGALIQPGHILCPDGEFHIQTFDVDDPNQSLQIGGVETQWKRVEISCIKRYEP